MQILIQILTNRVGKYTGVGVDINGMYEIFYSGVVCTDYETAMTYIQNNAPENSIVVSDGTIQSFVNNNAGYYIDVEGYVQYNGQVV